MLYQLGRDWLPLGKGTPTAREWHSWHLKHLCEVPRGCHCSWPFDEAEERHQPLLPAAAWEGPALPLACGAFHWFEFPGLPSQWDIFNCKEIRHRKPRYVCLFLSPSVPQRRPSAGVRNGLEGGRFLKCQWRGQNSREAFRAPAGCQQAPCGLRNVCAGEGMEPQPLLAAFLGVPHLRMPESWPAASQAPLEGPGCA